MKGTRTWNLKSSRRANGTLSLAALRLFLLQLIAWTRRDGVVTIEAARAAWGDDARLILREAVRRGVVKTAGLSAVRDCATRRYAADLSGA